MASRTFITRVALALLLMAVALSAVGCGRRGGTTTFPVPSAAAPGLALEATGAAAPPSEAPTGDAQTPSGQGTSASAGSGLTSSQAGALDAELSAIETELDRLSLPGDNDFDSIGSGLK